MTFPPFENSNHAFVLVSIGFPYYSKREAPFHCKAYGFFCVDLACFCDHLRDVPWEDIFKLGSSTAASKFCERVLIGIDVYIPHRKFQV